jgi:protein-L-isoaspartate O-methyltransferase
MFWVALDPDDVGYSPLARSHGYWEPGITCWMAKQIIREDMFCVDVGANHGYYTFLLAAFGAKVVAVEPQAKLFDLLSNARR